MKNRNIVTIIPQEEAEFEKWMASLRPYVLQTALQNRFDITKEIGEGSYGKVYLASLIKRRSEQHIRIDPRN
jgi:hypothetical protein